MSVLTEEQADAFQFAVKVLNERAFSDLQL